MAGVQRFNSICFTTKVKYGLKSSSGTYINIFTAKYTSYKTVRQSHTPKNYISDQHKTLIYSTLPLHLIYAHSFQKPSQNGAVVSPNATGQMW
jgi:hypothetical protein